MNLTRTKNRLLRLLAKQKHHQEERNTYADRLEAAFGMSLYAMTRAKENELVFSTDIVQVALALHILPNGSHLRETAREIQTLWTPWERPEFGGIKDSKQNREARMNEVKKRMEAIRDAEKVFDQYTYSLYMATKYGETRGYKLPELPEGYPPYPTEERQKELKELIWQWQWHHVQMEDYEKQIDTILNEVKCTSLNHYRWAFDFIHEHHLQWYSAWSYHADKLLKSLPDDDAREKEIASWRGEQIASFIRMNGPTEEGLVNPRGAGVGKYIQADCGCIYQVMSDKQVIAYRLRQGRNPEYAYSDLYPYMKLAVPSEKCRVIYFSPQGGFPRWGAHESRIGTAVSSFKKQFRVVEKPEHFEATPTPEERAAQGFISRAR